MHRSEELEISPVKALKSSSSFPVWKDTRVAEGHEERLEAEAVRLCDANRELKLLQAREYDLDSRAPTGRIGSVPDPPRPVRFYSLGASERALIERAFQVSQRSGIFGDLALRMEFEQNNQGIRLWYGWKETDTPGAFIHSSFFFPRKLWPRKAMPYPAVSNDDLFLASLDPGILDLSIYPEWAWWDELPEGYEWEEDE